MGAPRGILFIYFVLLVQLVYSGCPSTSYVDPYDKLPAAPVFTTASLSSSLTPTPTPTNPLTKGHWSEVAQLSKYRPPKVTPSANPTSSDCPHTKTGLKNWHDPTTWASGKVPTNGQTVNVPANTKVLVASCSVDPGTVFGVVNVPATSELIFGDANITFDAIGFNVNGSLLIGSETCRLRNKITITLHGSRSAQTVPADPWIKGMGVAGTIDVHGVLYTPTWTRLAMTAKINDTWIFIQDAVNWQKGQTIVITTTELKDSRDWHRNEERIIADVKVTSLGTTDEPVFAIQVDRPLDYLHFGGSEYQAEVALLSRNIVIQGDATNSEPTDTANAVCQDPKDNSTYPCTNSYLTGFGAHVMVYGTNATGRFSGVEMYRVGQTNALARYPIHFHMMFNQTQYNYNKTYVQDCSVHRSYFRCYAIHGTQGVRLSQNTAYDAIGHCYFLEDGVEENNLIEFNQAAHVHPLGPYQNPSLTLNGDTWGSQYLSNYNISDTLLLPSDMSAAGFYITNPYSDFVGNAASGGWAGFAMPALRTPVKLFASITDMSPAGRPFRSPFRGNSAHSSGYWWQTAGSIYVGGELSQPDGVLSYTAGRSLTHDTCSDQTAGTPAVKLAGCNTLANQLWLRFEDNKVFLSNRGLQDWGNRAEIIRFELHDVSLATNVFGQVWIDQMLMECRTNNHVPTWFNGCPAANAATHSVPKYGQCNIRDFTFFTSFGGFQWYDVGQQHILTNSTFRNCRNDWQNCVYGPSGTKNCGSTAVFTSLTHSDEFVPELMQVTRDIVYENVTDLWRYTTSTTSAQGITVSGRCQNWYDYDGSASETNVRTMIGSDRANGWWKYNDDCVIYDEAYKCKLSAGDGAASLIMHHNTTWEKSIGDSICMNPNPGNMPCPVIGQASHFGATNESDGFSIAVNAKVTGPIIASSGGWFFRFTAGTPNPLNFTSIQLQSPDDLLIVAIPYPSGTTFNISYHGASWCNAQKSECTHYFHAVSSLDEVRASFGDSYFWDDKARTLYMRLVQTADSFGAKGTDPPIWSPFPIWRNFSRGGQILFSPSSASTLVVNASCATQPCAPQTGVAIPAAINIAPPTTTSTTASTTAGFVASSSAQTFVSALFVACALALAIFM